MGYLQANEELCATLTAASVPKPAENVGAILNVVRYVRREDQRALRQKGKKRKGNKGKGRKGEGKVRKNANVKCKGSEVCGAARVCRKRLWGLKGLKTCKADGVQAEAMEKKEAGKGKRKSKEVKDSAAPEAGEGKRKSNEKDSAAPEAGEGKTKIKGEGLSCSRGWRRQKEIKGEGLSCSGGWQRQKEIKGEGLSCSGGWRRQKEIRGSVSKPFAEG
jgi:hypothetical protein